MTTFIICGAAARGAYQASLLNTLDQQGIVADAVFGVSSGAINAVGYACCGSKVLVDIWSNLHGMSDIFSFSPSALLSGRGIMNAKPISKVLFSHVSAPRIPVTIAKAEVATGKVVYVNSATSTIQELFDSTVSALSIPVAIDNWQGFCDAGPFVMAPVQEAVKQGHKDLTFILDRPLRPAPVLPIKGFGAINLANLAIQTIDHLLYSVLMKDLQWAQENKAAQGLTLTIYHPKDDLYNITEFKKIPEGILAGKSNFVREML